MSTLFNDTEIMAYRTPEVRKGILRIPVLVRGEWHGLCATERVWKLMLVDIAAHLGVRVVMRTEARGRGKLPNPERWMRLYRLHAEMVANPHVSHREIAHREGINLTCLIRDLKSIRDGSAPSVALLEQIKNRPPVMKPGGKIL